MSAITTPDELTSALPAIVSDLTNLNSTLAPLGNILNALNPTAVVGGATGTGAGTGTGTGTGTGGNSGGLLCSLGGILKRQTGSGITGLGELDDITNVLQPLVQILSSVLNAVTSLVGINSKFSLLIFSFKRTIAYTSIGLTGTLTGGESDQLTGPLSGILGTVGGLVPISSITQLLNLKV